MKETKKEDLKLTVKDIILTVLFLLIIVSYFKLNVVHDFINNYFRGINEILDDMWYYITEYRF